MTNHDIEMQQRHEDASVYGSPAKELLADCERARQIVAAYNDYMQMLHEPTLIGLIGEAVCDADTDELAKLIQAEPKDFAAIGVLVCQIVQNHVLQVAKKDVAREMGE